MNCGPSYCIWLNIVQSFIYLAHTGKCSQKPPPPLTCLLGTEIHHQVLVRQGVAFEAGSQQNVLVVHRYQTERSRGSHVELLEGLKALSEIIPQVHPGEGEITSENEVLAEAHCERIHSH